MESQNHRGLKDLDMTCQNIDGLEDNYLKDTHNTGKVTISKSNEGILSSPNHSYVAAFVPPVTAFRAEVNVL